MPDTRSDKERHLESLLMVVRTLYNEAYRIPEMWKEERQAINDAARLLEVRVDRWQETGE